MARKLRRVTSFIDGHLALRFGELDRLPKGRAVTKDPKAAPIRAATLQGEALLRLHFFEYCRSKGIQDAISQMKIWDRLIEKPAMFVEICERSTLNKYSRYLLPQNADQPYASRCFQLVCLLLIDLQENGEKSQEFWHLLQGHYQGMIAKS